MQCGAWLKNALPSVPTDDPNEGARPHALHHAPMLAASSFRQEGSAMPRSLLLLLLSASSVCSGLRGAHSRAASPPQTPKERLVVLPHKDGAVLKTPSPPTHAARSRLMIGDCGPSDSARAAARGWRLLTAQPLTGTRRAALLGPGARVAPLGAIPSSPVLGGSITQQENDWEGTRRIQMRVSKERGRTAGPDATGLFRMTFMPQDATHYLYETPIVRSHVSSHKLSAVPSFRGKKA